MTSSIRNITHQFSESKSFSPFFSVVPAAHFLLQPVLGPGGGGERQRGSQRGISRDVVGDGAGPRRGAHRQHRHRHHPVQKVRRRRQLALSLFRVFVSVSPL